MGAGAAASTESGETGDEFYTDDAPGAPASLGDGALLVNRGCH